MKTNDQKHKTYNVLPGPKMGMITPEYLAEIAAVTKKHNVPLLKITGAQRLAIGGHAPEVAEKIWQELGQPTGPEKPVGIHYIQACPGFKWCKYGRQDSLALGRMIEEAFMDRPLPAKTKVGISGCQFNCCESYIRDLGVFGTTKGWTVVFGGNGGGCPRIGDVVGEELSAEEVLELLGRCLDFFSENARRLERTGRLMRRTSLATLKMYLQK